MNSYENDEISNVHKGDLLEDKFYNYLLEQQDNGELIHGLYPADQCKIYKKKSYYCNERGADVTFDVVIEIYRKGAQDLAIAIVFECKNHSSNVPEDKITDFSDKLQRIFKHNAKGVVVVASGLQSGARNLVERRGIGLVKYDQNGFETILQRQSNGLITPTLIEKNIFQSLSNTKSNKFSSYYDGNFFSSIGTLLQYLCGEQADIIDTNNSASVPYIAYEEIDAKASNFLNSLSYSGGEVDLAKICKKNKLIYKKVININSKETFKWISKINYDYIFCIGFSQLIKGPLLNNNKNKIIGFHPTDLPYNKGRHPIIWSVILGLKKSAISFFIINKKADSGKIILKKNFNITENSSSTFIYKKITSLVLNNLENLKVSLKNKISIKKDKRIIENSWRKREFEDGVIDWRMSASNIYRHYLALTNPYPNVSFKYKKKFYKIKKCTLIKTSRHTNLEPGKIIFKSTKNLFIKCGDGVLKIEKIEPKINLKKIKYLK